MSEIDTYQAGRELDALIAKEVFGIEAIYSPTWGWNYFVKTEKSVTQYQLPRYSTIESDAFQVVKYLCRDDREPHDLYFKLTYAWCKGHALTRAVFDWKETEDNNPLYQGLADTIPLAICRAALRVVREDLSYPEYQNPTNNQRNL